MQATQTMPVMERPVVPDRARSSYSVKSDKSGSSAKPRRDSLRESFDKKRMTMDGGTKANPNFAMNEAQPIAAALEKPTLQSLRAFSHTDSSGNVISEPDLSNPTRPRWERPLDTIRSFEAAIDTEYKRRSQFRPETSTDVNGNTSRRGSYYAGDYSSNLNRQSSVGGYYGGRGTRDSYMDGTLMPPMNAPSRNRFSARMQSDSAVQRMANYGQGVYPSPGHHQSRDTVNTGVSNGSQSDPLGNSTDPSSDNSSIDPNFQPPKPEQPSEHFGFSGFGGAPQYNGPIIEERADYGVHGEQLPPPPPHHQQYSQPRRPVQNPNDIHQRNANIHTYNIPPPVPRKTQPVVEQYPVTNKGKSPITPLAPAHNANNVVRKPSVLQRGGSEKRKSWFKRRFSKE